MDLPRELGDLLGQLLVLTRQLRVGLEEVGQLVRLHLDRGDPLLREAHLFVVVLIGPLFQVLIAISPVGLREQDQRCRVGGLYACSDESCSSIWLRWRCGAASGTRDVWHECLSGGGYRRIVWVSSFTRA